MVSITCTGCNKTYQIPDSELPENKPVDLLCPECSTVLRVQKDQQQTRAETKTPTLSGPELMEKIVQTSKALPPMPQIIARANEVLSSDNSGFREISQVLETDQAMATRVLRIANSAYYGVSVPVTSVQQASALLGFQTLFELITVVSSSKMMGKHLQGYNIEAKFVWKHSLSVAVGAKAIAEKYHPELVNDAFMSGLIHDSGMVLLDSRIHEHQRQFNELLARGKTLQDAEMEMFEFDHAALAARYLKKWKLPENLTHAIRYHHSPAECGHDPLACILHISDAMANTNNLESNFIMDDSALDAIGMPTDDLDQMTFDMEDMVDSIIKSMEA